MPNASTPHAPITLIAGLGNPGDQYAGTRHNVGAWWVDAVAAQIGVTFKLEQQLKAHVAKGTHGVRLMRPTTFMNESGQALRAVMQYYKILPESVLVVHDELDFAPGIARLKWSGGHGGHNGLRDIIRLVDQGFWRLRLGIGHPGHKDRVHGYVLKAPMTAQQHAMDDAIQRSLGLLPDLLNGDFQQAMRTLHEED